MLGSPSPTFPESYTAISIMFYCATRTEFLYFGTLDTGAGQFFGDLEIYGVHHGVFSSISGFSSLHTNGIPAPVSTAINVPRYSQMFSGDQVIPS